MNKTLVFDMDGTIADFYDVQGWLESILARDVKPYATAKPMYDMDVLNTILDALKGFGWRIAVTSWLAKSTTDEYDRKVTKAKLAWLAENGFPYDIVNIVPYGTDKSSVTARYGGYQILLDDEEKNLKDWKNGLTIDANCDILSMLLKMIDREV